MARKPNYNFEKRKKEQDRKARKDAKRDEAARRRQEGVADEPDASTTDATGGDNTPPE